LYHCLYLITLTSIHPVLPAWFQSLRFLLPCIIKWRYVYWLPIEVNS
jgi:hypothetical protein